MIEDGDPHQIAGADQAFRQDDVVFARRGIPRRVIVEEDDGRGAGAGGGPEDFTRMDDTGVERPDGEQRRARDPVLGVEQQQPKVFDGQRAELRHEQLRGIDRREDLDPFAAGTHERAAPGFDRRQELCRPGAADPRHFAQIVGRRSRQSVQAADGREHRVGELQRTRPRVAVAQDDREKLVVAEPGRADTFELFTRPIMRRHGLHCRAVLLLQAGLLLYFPVVRRLPVIFLLVLLISGCSGPPQKEIDQAQAAIDAARGAGAERYASSEYGAAAAALQKAHAAVDQRDYRQALNYAIDARQRAADATTQAAEGKARARTATEALYGEVATRANQLQTALRGAETAAPAKALRAGQASLRDARGHLQKASAAISAGNYEDATKTLREVRGKLDAALVDVQNIPPRPARKRTRSAGR